MSELITKLNIILQEKQNKIIPENIKKDIQIFDVIGTYEGSGGTDYNVKLFETKEEMQADTTAKEGDLAVVYRSEMQNMTADTQTQFITFPETVTLQEAFAGNASIEIRAVDSSVMFSGNVRLDQNSFRFNGFISTGMIRISYTSTDGVNYTREEFTGNGELTNPVDLGTIIKVSNSEAWNDVLGHFMQVKVNTFEGLFEYDGIQYNIVETQLDATADLLYNSTAYGKNGVIEGILTQNVSNSFTDMNAKIYSEIQQAYNNMEPRVLTDTDKEIDKNIYIIPTKFDGTVLLDTSQVTDMNYMFSGCSKLIDVPELNTSKATNMYSMFSSCSNLTKVSLLDTADVTNMTYMFQGCTSLTTIPQLDTSAVTSMTNMFQGCTSLTTIPLLNTSKVTNMLYMFNSCTSLTTIPLLNTSAVTNMTYMFNSCTNLQEIPLLNTSAVTNMSNMFQGCTSLTNDSLNNILAMLTNATSYTGTKTLKYIGLSETQATTCTTLSNWAACEEAGWTTGY